MKLQICDLCKQFDGVPVLDHVSMGIILFGFGLTIQREIRD